MREAWDKYLLERDFSLLLRSLSPRTFSVLELYHLFFFFLIGTTKAHSGSGFRVLVPRKPAFFLGSMSIRFFMFVVKAKHLLLPTFFSASYHHLLLSLVLFG